MRVIEYGDDKEREADCQIQYFVYAHKHHPFPQDPERVESASPGCPVKRIIETKWFSFVF